MLEVFRMAEQTRREDLKGLTFKELMESAATAAGYHRVYVDNLQRADKWQTRYERPFSSEVTSELICRMKPYIIGFLRKRDIDPSTISSHIAYGIYSFIKSYNPEKHNTDAIIKASLYQAVVTRVQQSNRKERFKYIPGYQGITNKERVAAELEGRAPKARYTTAPKETSLNRTINDKKGEGSVEIGDLIPSPSDFTIEVEGKITIFDRYATTPLEKSLLELLVEFGSSGKIGRTSLLGLANREPEIIGKIKLKISQDSGLEEDEVPDELVERQLMKVIKTYYKSLKRKLMEDYFN